MICETQLRLACQMFEESFEVICIEEILHECSGTKLIFFTSFFMTLSQFKYVSSLNFFKMCLSGSSSGCKAFRLESVGIEVFGDVSST